MYISEWWIRCSEEIASRVYTIRGCFSTSQEGVWDAENWIWTDSCSKRADR